VLELAHRERGLGPEAAIDPQRGGPSIQLPLDCPHRVATAAGGNQDNEGRPGLIADDPIDP
jgi:hypothetical protein